MTVAAHPSANPCAWTFVQSTPVSLRQFAGSKSLLPFLGADVIPGIAFPRSCECYRGSLGPRFPTLPGSGLSPAPRYCALLRLPSSIPVGPLLAPFRYLGLTRSFVSLPACAGVGSSAGRVGQLHARVLIAPVTLAPAIAPKETGGSPEFPDYPFVHMPRSQTPVVSRPLALARTGLLPSERCIPSALGPVARTYPAVHHYTFFGVQ